MSRYRMDDGTVVDTNNAQESWDGSNHISRLADLAHEVTESTPIMLRFRGSPFPMTALIVIWANLQQTKHGGR